MKTIEQIKSNDYYLDNMYCSEITILDKTFTLKASSDEELKNKKMELYFHIHEMIVAELQKLELNDEKSSSKHSK